MDLVFDGLGLQLLDCCAELSVNFVNALGPLEVKHCPLLDNSVSGLRRHFFDFVTFVYLVPQPAIDLGQMRENRADLPVTSGTALPSFDKPCGRQKSAAPPECDRWRHPG